MRSTACRHSPHQTAESTFCCNPLPETSHGNRKTQGNPRHHSQQGHGHPCCASHQGQSSQCGEKSPGQSGGGTCGDHCNQESSDTGQSRCGESPGCAGDNPPKSSCSTRSEPQSGDQGSSGSRSISCFSARRPSHRQSGTRCTHPSHSIQKVCSKHKSHHASQSGSACSQGTRTRGQARKSRCKGSHPCCSGQSRQTCQGRQSPSCANHAQPLRHLALPHQRQALSQRGVPMSVHGHTEKANLFNSELLNEHKR